MYNKLFTSILDSSIWLAPTPARIVWVTLLAAMDEDGYAHFASLANLAHRAMVSLDEATDAVTILESPDVHSSDPEHEGRRIERVPGGWMVLNAHKYAELASREAVKSQTRDRVRRFRERERRNANVTHANDLVAQSDTDTDTDTVPPIAPHGGPVSDDGFDAFWNAYPRHVGKVPARKAYGALKADEGLRRVILAAIAAHARSAQWTAEGGKYIPHPATWLRQRRFEDELPLAARVPLDAPAEDVYARADARCQHEPRCATRELHALLLAREGTA